MAISLSEFAQQLVESGLMSKDEVRAFRSGLPAEKRTDDVQEFARELVRQKKITAYQGSAVYQGKGSSLQLGGYTILDKLGQGGMGMVFKAEHNTMKRIVALKVLPPAATKSSDNVKRFHREVQAAAKLTHPNIVAAFDAGEANRVHFLVMEFVDGSDLSQIVKKQGPLPVDKAVQCIVQAARGLEAAHEAGIIHRDIKPANLLLDHSGIVKILDMGLARMDEGVAGNAGAAGAGMTQTGTIMGTVDYMSPEQALNTKNADARADIYSLGCALYFLLTGRAPYQGETLMEKLLAHREQPIPSLKPLCANAPPALQTVFGKMVAKQPQDRYQSMGEVIRDLQTSLTASANSIASSNSLQQFAVAPEEESELLSFLRQQAEPTVGLAGSNAFSEFESSGATIKRSSPISDTKPSLSRASRSTRPDSGNRNLLIAGGVGTAAVFIFMAFLMTRGSSTPQVADKVPKTGEQSTSETVTSSTTTKSVDYALSFKSGKDGSRVTSESLKIQLNQPITIEGFLSPSSTNGQQTSLYASNIINIRSGQGIWKGVTWRKPKKVLNVDSTVPAQLNRRTHVAAVVVPGSSFRLFVDGELAASQSLLNETLTDEERPFEMGWDFAGLIDEVRVSNVARYTAKFAPPSSSFATDANTLALYHFDEGNGNLLRDSSGNNHHGQISNAEWVRVDGSPIASPAANSTNFALQFESEGGEVNIQGLSLNTLESFTMEAYVASPQISGTTDALVMGIREQSFLAYARANRWRWSWPTTKAAAKPEKGISGVQSSQERTHIACVREGQTHRLYVNGALARTQEVTAPLPIVKAGTFQIGVGFLGTIDEIRVSKTARYNAEFHPKPRFESDAETLALFHCDEGSGTVLKDTSGNNRHGTISGVKWVRAESELKSTPAVPPGNYALEFPAQSDKAFVFVDDKLKLDTARTLTLEGWVTYSDNCNFGALVAIPRDIADPKGPLDPFVALRCGANRPAWNAVFDSNVLTDDQTFVLKQRVHVALVVDLKQIRLHVDGVVADRKPFANVPSQSLSGAFLGHRLDGVLDEVRISQTARYNKPFKPEIRFSPDGNTLALYHFDEGEGEIALDSSGNNRHGKIVGAKWVPVEMPKGK